MDQEEADGDATEPGTRVVGAYDFKGWWTAIWFTGPEVRFPEACSCCGQLQDVGAERLPIDPAGTEPAVSFPVCGFCARHARQDERIVAIAMVGGILVALLLWWGLGFAVLSRGVGVSLMALVVLAIAMMGAIYTPLKALVQVRPGCPDPGWPVEIDLAAGGPLLGAESERADDRLARQTAEGFSGAGASFGLRIRKAGFAREVIELNGGDPDAVLEIEAKT